MFKKFILKREIDFAFIIYMINFFVNEIYIIYIIKIIFIKINKFFIKC